MKSTKSDSGDLLLILMVLFTAITAINHLLIGMTSLRGGISALPILFILNGIGYAVLLAGVATDRVPVLSDNKALAHYALIAFTVVTIVAYFLMSGVLSGEPAGTAAIITKVDEVLLIVVSFLHLRAA